jgi:hypothetical protein
MYMTVEIIIRAMMVGFVLSIIGLFTQKKLNPRYEELIEKRMNRVAYLALAAIVFALLIHIVLDIWRWRTKLGVPAPVVYTSVGLMCLVLGICTYHIARLKGHGGWQCVVWALFGATGTGLLAILLCANYYPIGEPPGFPIYRGCKITFPCGSCGKHLSDYQCNAGTEGVCPKCGNSRIVPTLKTAQEEKKNK